MGVGGPGRSPGVRISKCVFRGSPGLYGARECVFRTQLVRNFLLVGSQPPGDGADPLLKPLDFWLFTVPGGTRRNPLYSTPGNWCVSPLVS